MKDYYKILGVDEEASEKEIRARWIELTKHYHPDLGKSRGEDERIKEINEAYEVLKDYSKRLDYDLERDLKRSIVKKAHSQKQRRFNIQKIIGPAGIVVLLLIVGLVVIRWPHVSKPPKSDDLHEIEKVLGKRAAPQTPPEKSESPPSSSLRGESKLKEEPARKIIPKSEVLPSPPVSQMEKEPKRKEEPIAPVVMKPEAPAKVEKEVPKEIPKEVLKEAPKEVRKDLPKEVTKVTLRPGEKLPETWVVSSPSPSFAKEEEVKQFFSNYIDRYNRKDINGFLSFFSSKVIQNQKEGLDRIRKIYSDFFDQSQEVQYHLEDTKIEIYQNGVEVRARYKLDQLLKKGGERKSWIGNIRWGLVKENGILKISSLDYQNEKSP
jgi:curved DNA-binding protein CbpA